MVLETAALALEKLSPARLSRPDYTLRGVHLDVVLAPLQIADFARTLLGLGFLIEDLTAVDASPELMVVDAGEVDGGPAARIGLADLSPVRLDAANAQLSSVGQEFDLIALRYRSGRQCTRNDRAKSLYRKAAVDRESCRQIIGPRRDP